MSETSETRHAVECRIAGEGTAWILLSPAVHRWTEIQIAAMNSGYGYQKYRKHTKPAMPRH